MLNAVIYARYSSDNQREESIEAQIRAIKEYASKNDYQIIKIYTDEARTATTDDRPQFLQMIKDSVLGLFNTVIVHKLDRFARNRYDSAIYRKKLKDNGVRLISVLEPLDDSPESVILESVLEGMSEYYSKNLSREVMKGMKETALECKHNGGIAPLGYDVAPDRTYVINENEAKIVKMVFEMYADGYSFNNIIDELNSKGYKTKAGREFGKNSINNILKNEKYRGVYIFNRTISKIGGKRNNLKSKSSDKIIRIEGGMPRIISDELWNRIRVKMDKNKQARAANSAKETYLLSGLIFCGKCDGAMTGNRKYAGRNKTPYFSYECSNRKRKRSCDAKAINKDYVENLVMDELEEELFTSDAIEKMVKSIIDHSKKQSKEIDKDIKSYENELAGIQTKLNNIVNAIADGLYQPSMKEKLDELEQRKSNIIITLSEAKRQKEVNSPSEKTIRTYLSKGQNIKSKSPEIQKQIIQTFVKKVTVYENTIDVDTIVSFNGGGEGSRTPVRKLQYLSISECSP